MGINASAGSGPIALMPPRVQLERLESEHVGVLAEELVFTGVGSGPPAQWRVRSAGRAAKPSASRTLDDPPAGQRVDAFRSDTCVVR